MQDAIHQVGRRLAAVLHANSIFDGIAGMRSFMAAVVHRHTLPTLKRNKNAAVITIGSFAFVKTGIYQLFQVLTDVYPKFQRVDSVFVFVISFLLHILNYICFDTISIADNNVFSLIPFPLPTPSFSIFSIELFIEHTASFMLSALLFVFSIADCSSSKRLSI